MPSTLALKHCINISYNQILILKSYKKCSFYSVAEERLRFVNARFAAFTQEAPLREALARLTRRRELPSGRFLAAVELVGAKPDSDSAAASAVLRLDVQCQRGDGLLRFESVQQLIILFVSIPHFFISSVFKRIRIFGFL